MLNNFLKGKFPLRTASIEAYTDYYLTLFCKYAKMVTMRNLYYDEGFSCTGITDDLIETFAKV